MSETSAVHNRYHELGIDTKEKALEFAIASTCVSRIEEDNQSVQDESPKHPNAKRERLQLRQPGKQAHPELIEVRVFSNGDTSTPTQQIDVEISTSVYSEAHSGYISNTALFVGYEARHFSLGIDSGSVLADYVSDIDNPSSEEESAISLVSAIKSWEAKPFDHTSNQK